MATAWPAVKAWLAAKAPTLPEFADATVFSGVPASQAAPAQYFAVGAVMEEDNAGTFSRQDAYDGTVWQEQGDVRSMIVAQSGQADGSANEAAAFAMAAALDTVIHADRTLGGTLSRDATVQTSVDVLAISNARGTATALVYVLHYTTIT